MGTIQLAGSTNVYAGTYGQAYESGCYSESAGFA
jgi:hypothetical protein